MNFKDLFELLAIMAWYEWLLKEETQRSYASIWTYYQDPNYELDVAEVILTKPITCAALRQKEQDKSLDMVSKKVTLHQVLFF